MGRPLDEAISKRWAASEARSIVGLGLGYRLAYSLSQALFSMGRLVLYRYIYKIVKKWILADVAPGGSVGWLSVGNCTNSGDVGSILDLS